MEEDYTKKEKLNRRQFLIKGIGMGIGLTCLPTVTYLLLKHIKTPKTVEIERQVSDVPIINPLHEARYYLKLEDNLIWCQMCFRKCIVEEGMRGFCRNKVNKGGKYYTLVHSKPCALQIDPIEKEPSFHLRPGGSIFCIATASCNNRCKFCHNWHISQRSIEETRNYDLSPKEVVKLAKEYNCDGISFTYSEPTVFYEYMYDIAKLAKKAGLLVLFHTNGSMNKEPLFALLKYMDAVTVDLKAFTHKFYQEISSSELDPVLRTLKNVKKAGKYLEIVNLLIPTLNDNKDDIKRMCQWIKENIGDETPIHFNRFSPAYKLTRLPQTPVKTLEEAREIAIGEGLKYIYIGNVPGHKYNSTYCHNCGRCLIQRIHFSILSNYVIQGRCKFCNHKIPGVWL